MGYKTDFEILLQQHIDLLRIEKELKRKEDSISSILNDLPGFLHLNYKKDVTVYFLNDYGSAYTELTSNEINELGAQYLSEYLDPYTTSVLGPKMIDFFQNGDNNRIFSFFQGFRKPGQSKFNTIYTVAKNLRKSGLVLSYSISIEDLGNISIKMDRVLKEETFLRNHYLSFKKLTPREIEVLTFLAQGFSNKRVSEQIFISTATVKQHRKNIKRKLGIGSVVEIVKYAQAFDLI